MKKLSPAGLRKLIREELFYREFYQGNKQSAERLDENYMQFVAPAFSGSPMKSRASREFADAIKGARRLNEAESYYPIAGTPNASWVTFENALWDAAAEMVDAGFPADGVQDAMIRAVEGTIGSFDLDDDYHSGF